MSDTPSSPSFPSSPSSPLPPDSLQALARDLAAFAQARDWGRFHAPKNLASALAVEAAELLEPFQWLSEAESRALNATQQAAVADEIADVLLYLVQLASSLQIDPVAAARAKLARNAGRFPVVAAPDDAPGEAAR